MSSEARGVAWRISAFFAAFFLVPGVHLPFWSVWLESRGLNATEIAIVMSSAILLRLVAGPAAAHLVDRSSARRQAIILLAWGSVAVFTAYWWAEGFWPIFLLGLLHGILWSPITPLTENIALLSAARFGVQYGRMRLWGSVSFLVAAYLSGLWLKGRPDDWILALLFAGTFVMACCSHLLPDIRLPLDRPKLGAPARLLLRSRLFLAFLGANACLQATHAMFYTFGTLHWRGAGLSDAQIGFLWAEGVLAEVILFAAGQRVALKVGGAGLLLLACAGGVLRWGLTGVVEDFPALVVLNLLHAATFGCAHLGAMRLMAEGVDPEVSATAQSLYTAANSAMLALATLAIGPVFAAIGGLAYVTMLPLSLAGGACAWLLWRRRNRLRFA